MKIKIIFVWYDFWVGLFYDKNKRWLYIFLVPTIGILLKFKYICPECGKLLLFSEAKEYCSRYYCYKCYSDNIYFDEEYR